jgi:hypothetical protein
MSVRQILAEVLRCRTRLADQDCVPRCFVNGSFWIVLGIHGSDFPGSEIGCFEPGNLFLSPTPKTDIHAEPVQDIIARGIFSSVKDLDRKSCATFAPTIAKLSRSNRPIKMPQSP